MRIYYRPRFKRSYRRLPTRVRAEAKKAEKIFRKDPFDARLRTHKLKGKLKSFWAFSVTQNHRIVFKFSGEGEVWFYDVGDHFVYQ